MKGLAASSELQRRIQEGLVKDLGGYRCVRSMVG